MENETSRISEHLEIEKVQIITPIRISFTVWRFRFITFLPATGQSKDLRGVFKDPAVNPEPLGV